MILNSKQKAQIRKMAQKQKASFQIGNKGLQDSSVTAINETFNNSEILKIKVHRDESQSKDIITEMGVEIARRSKSVLCGTIGNTIVLYKENEKMNPDDKIKFK